MRGVVFGLLVGCANLFPPERPQQTPEERLQLAWKGRPVFDMESHAAFSTMEGRLQPLSDGSLDHLHPRCRALHSSATESRKCMGEF